MADARDFVWAFLAQGGPPEIGLGGEINVEYGGD